MNLYQFLSGLILFYGYTVYYISYAFYKCCNVIMKYYPDSAIPNCLHKTPILNNNKKINIKNIQFASNDSKIPIDITNKGKILIKLLWNKKIKHMKNNNIIRSGGFMLNDFVKYIGKCILLYIDYQIDKDGNKIKKIIDLSDEKHPKYLNIDDWINSSADELPACDIPIGGEIIFD